MKVIQNTQNTEPDNTESRHLKTTTYKNKPKRNRHPRIQEIIAYIWALAASVADDTTQRHHN